ncbi:MAG: hypothetical protein HYV63_34260 [Candidatus Schekmanbacteria bacterium]|nr:hypothetical protein [Candidatus Schekmanbacteria bacterium]
MRRLLGCGSALFLLALMAAPTLCGTPVWAAEKLTLKDPASDDDGPGRYVYPTDKNYIPGSFDVLSVDVEERGEDVVFTVQVRARLEDPWDSKGWGGNGFSLQHVQIYIDKDHKEGSGLTDALPGIHANFKSDEAWDAVVILHAQGNSRVKTEVEAKSPANMAKAVVLPTRTYNTGKNIVGVVSKAELGAPEAGWGYQVLMQSNEGFPDAKDMLSRKVNEYEGQHRFGGGDDYEGDPHFIDMLVAPAQGTSEEKDKQHEIMGNFESGADEKKNRWVVVPMVYPGK